MAKRKRRQPEQVVKRLLSRRPAQPAERPSPLWALLVALLVFLAIWIWLFPGIYLLAWGAWFGDSMPRWFERAYPFVAAGLALVYPAWMVIIRVRAGRASRGYLQIHFAAAVALLALMGALQSYEWTSRIHGATPRAAAVEYLEKIQFSAEDTPYRLVEESRSGKAESGGPQWVTYKILGARGTSLGRITVARYSRFWWTFASYEGFRPPGEALERAKELLHNPARRSTAVRILREVVSNHRGTAEAAGAERLLEQMEPESR